MTTVTFWTKYLQAGLPFDYADTNEFHCQADCEDCIHNDVRCTEHMTIFDDDLRTLMNKFPEDFL